MPCSNLSAAAATPAAAACSASPHHPGASPPPPPPLLTAGAGAAKARSLPGKSYLWMSSLGREWASYSADSRRRKARDRVGSAALPGPPLRALRTAVPCSPHVATGGQAREMGAASMSGCTGTP